MITESQVPYDALNRLRVAKTHFGAAKIIPLEELRRRNIERRVAEKERQRELKAELRAARLTEEAARKERVRLREMKFEQQYLDFLHLCSSGLRDVEIAKALGINQSLISERKRKAAMVVAKRSELPFQVVWATFNPRRISKVPRNPSTSDTSCYSGPAISFERVASLNRWETVVSQVQDAQDEMARIALSDVEIALREGPPQPYSPTVAYRYDAEKGAWQIWSMDGWGA